MCNVTETSSVSLSLSLWSVSAVWSRYCRWWSRIVQASVPANTWGQLPRQALQPEEKACRRLLFSPLRPPPPRWTRGCPHMWWFALVWMCKEDVEVDPERLTHRLLQYPLATRASWQRWASHTWQTFNHFKHINSPPHYLRYCSWPAINLHPHDIR